MEKVKITLTSLALNKAVLLEYLWGIVSLSEAAVHVCYRLHSLLPMTKWSKYWNILPVCIFIALLKKRGNAIITLLKAGTSWLWFLQLKFTHLPKSLASKYVRWTHGPQWKVHFFSFDLGDPRRFRNSHLWYSKLLTQTVTLLISLSTEWGLLFSGTDR